MVFELKGVRKAYGSTRVFEGIDLYIERGDRIALLGPNGAGKSTLMRMLSGVEEPDAGTRTSGHEVVTQYFAQDEAVRLAPELTIYETLSSGSPVHMVPMIRDILGGFGFSGDDIFKRVGVLSGGERTRLAVARMLLRPSNTLLLDEPTNHLDLTVANQLITAYPDLNMIIGTDATAGSAIARALKETGKDGKIKCVAMDRDQDMLGYVEDGTITATLAQNSVMEEWMATHFLYWLTNNSIPEFKDWREAGAPQAPRWTDIGVSVVTKDNVKYYKKEA